MHVYYFWKICHLHIWFYLIIWQVGVAFLELYIHSLLKLEILLLKGDWSISIIPKQNAVVKYVQALGHWEFNRHAQKHMKRREDIPQIIYPKYYKKYANTQDIPILYILHYCIYFYSS